MSTIDMNLAQRIEDALMAQRALPDFELCDDALFAEDTRVALQSDERWLEERRRRRALQAALSGEIVP